MPGIALGARLADADDGQNPGATRGKRLSLHRRVGFAVVLAALGMADNDGLRAGILEHLGGNVSRIGACGERMAILAADGDPRAARSRGEVRDQRRRGAHHYIDIREFLRPGDDFLQFARRGLQAVHFPIACNQWAARHR